MFSEQEAEGWEVWMYPNTKLRMPRVINLRRDPFERAMDEAIEYSRWMIERMFMFSPAVVKVKEFMATFKEYPPSQKSSSWVD